MAKRLRRMDVCANCGRDIPGENFCPTCGQENTDQIVSARHLLWDIVDEFLKFDSKLLTTLAPLLRRPGFLTKEYLAGRRARYITPLRLYFIVSALYFVCFSWSGTSQFVQTIASDQQKQVASMLDQVQVSADSSKNTPEIGLVQTKIKRIGRRIFALQSWLLTNMSFITYFFIPLTALVMQLLYLRSKRLYVEHLVFTAHVNAFAYLISVPIMFLRNYLVFTIVSGLAAPIYTFLALRVVYPQSVFKTLVKCILILFVPAFCFMIVVVLAFAVVLIAGLVGG